MRWFVRFFLLIVLGFGVLLGFVYPWAAQRQGDEIGRWRVYTAGGDFVPVETRLPADEEQVRILVEVATTTRVNADRAVVLTMTATSGGRTQIAQTFTLDGVEPGEGRSTLPVLLYSLEAETLYSIEDEPYIFVFGPGEVELPLVYVELVLIGGTFDYDESVPPIGYALTAIGFVGLVLTFRRRRETPPPRWGRG